MNTYQERRKKSLDRRKKQSVENWFSSFMVTAVVVVTVVVLAPISPKATFLQIEPFGSDLYYQIEVVDEGETITPGTLKIKAENSLEYYEYEIPLGISSGSFEGLKPSTSYIVSIVAKRGFGEEVLQKQTIKTENNYGGRIIEAIPEVVDTGYMHEVMYNYYIKTAYNDRKNEIQSVVLQYAYLYEYIEGETEEPDEANMTFFSIDTPSQTTLIEFVPGYNGVLFLRLVATLHTSEVVILDQAIIRTPVHLESYLYVDDVGPTSIDVTVYPDFSIVSDVKYYVRLIRNSVILKEYAVIENPNLGHYDGYEYTFSNLLVDSFYHVVLFATYTEPTNLQKQEKILMNTRVSTTKQYTLSIQHSANQTDYTLSITLNDAHQTIRNMRYIIYSIVDEMQYYESQTSIVLDDLGNNQYQSVASIPIPNFDSYRIIVFIDKYITLDQTYYWVEVYEITN